MRSKRFRTLAIVATAILAIVLAASATAAMPPIQGTGGVDPDAGNDLATTHSVHSVVGDDADETGYSGPVNAGETSQITATDPDYQEQLLPMDRFSLDGEPDSVGAREPEWTGFYYFFPSGSTLHPTDSAVGSNYNPGACVNATGASVDFFTIYEFLPQGSRIDYVRIYYKDTSGTNSRVLLRKYDGAGGTSTVGEVSSAGNSGFGSQLSPYIGHIVDNTNGSYVLNWQANVTGSSMQLCGVRVAYRLPS